MLNDNVPPPRSGFINADPARPGPGAEAVVLLIEDFSAKDLAFIATEAGRMAQEAGK